MKNSSCGYLIVFTLSLLLYSCGKQMKESVGLLNECSVIATKNVTASGDTVIVCDVSSVKESMVIPLSKLIDSLEIIRLENIDTAMINPVKVDITDSYIGANAYSAYKLFTRSGKYLTDIGRRGQGPGEYLFVYDSQIDEASNRIYLMPWSTKNMYVYDLQGNFLRNISLPYLVHKAIINVDVEKQHISIVQVPFEDEDVPLAWTQDFDGQIIHEVKLKYLDLWPDYTNEVFTQKADKSKRFADFNLYSFVPRADSLYYYDAVENRCIPKFTVNFQGDGIPGHIYYEVSDYYMTDIINKNPYVWIVDSRIIVDKATLKGGQFKIVIDELGGIPIELHTPTYSNFDYLAYSVEPGKLQIMIEEQLSHKERMSSEEVSKLVDFNNTISEDDNSYILLGKWK